MFVSGENLPLTSVQLRARKEGMSNDEKRANDSNVRNLRDDG